MPTRQYIGARYVTKIYENSQDASSAEWEANVNYEPLTMVTYNNGSYLSKKEVPASIGNPAVNANYWIQTGFYNGQIAVLTDAVNDLITMFSEIGYNENDITPLLKSNHQNVVEFNERQNVDLPNGIIQVATFNTHSIGVRTHSFKSYLMNGITQNIISEIGADITAFQEFAQELWGDITDFYNGMYSDYDYQTADTNIMGTTGNATFGSGFTTKTVKYMPSHSGEIPRCIDIVKTNIGTKTLSIFNFHLTYNPTYRSEQISTLYNAVSADTSEYKVLLGDTNLDTNDYTTYFSDFVNDGFKFVNKGQYISFPSGNVAYDEIIVSSNINIIDTGMLDVVDKYSADYDHNPVFARIELA